MVDYLGVALIVFGVIFVVSTLSGIVYSPQRTVWGWFWTVLWLGIGGAMIYYGWKRQTPAVPPPFYAPAIPATAGRRRRY